MAYREMRLKWQDLTINMLILRLSRALRRTGTYKATSLPSSLKSFIYSIYADLPIKQQTVVRGRLPVLH